MGLSLNLCFVSESVSVLDATLLLQPIMGYSWNCYERHTLSPSHCIPGCEVKKHPLCVFVRSVQIYRVSGGWRHMGMFGLLSGTKVMPLLVPEHSHK